jgi:hypothetical protein
VGLPGRTNEPRGCCLPPRALQECHQSSGTQVVFKYNCRVYQGRARRCRRLDIPPAVEPPNWRSLKRLHISTSSLFLLCSPWQFKPLLRSCILSTLLVIIVSSCFSICILQCLISDVPNPNTDCNVGCLSFDGQELSTAIECLELKCCGLQTCRPLLRGTSCQEGPPS